MLILTAGVAAVFQVLTFGGVVGQADRAFIGRESLFLPSEPVQQVGAGGLGRLEPVGVLSGFGQQRVERGQSRRGPVDLGGDGGEGDTAAEGGLDCVQDAVQGEQQKPSTQITGLARSLGQRISPAA